MNNFIFSRRMAGNSNIGEYPEFEIIFENLDIYNYLHYYMGDTPYTNDKDRKHATYITYSNNDLNPDNIIFENSVSINDPTIHVLDSINNTIYLFIPYTENLQYSYSFSINANDVDINNGENFYTNDSYYDSITYSDFYKTEAYNICSYVDAKVKVDWVNNYFLEYNSPTNIYFKGYIVTINLSQLIDDFINICSINITYSLCKNIGNSHIQLYTKELKFIVKPANYAHITYMDEALGHYSEINNELVLFAYEHIQNDTPIANLGLTCNNKQLYSYRYYSNVNMIDNIKYNIHEYHYERDGGIFSDDDIVLHMLYTITGIKRFDDIFRDYHRRYVTGEIELESLYDEIRAVIYDQFNEHIDSIFKQYFKQSYIDHFNEIYYTDNSEIEYIFNELILPKLNITPCEATIDINNPNHIQFSKEYYENCCILYDKPDGDFIGQPVLLAYDTYDNTKEEWYWTYEAITQIYLRVSNIRRIDAGYQEFKSILCNYIDTYTMLASYSEDITARSYNDYVDFDIITNYNIINE